MKLPVNDDGFTLIEALVAMAVLAVASAGLIRATEAHIDLIRGIELRTVAAWVAENRLAELALPNAAGLPTTVSMLGRDWRVTTTPRASDDPDITAVEVAVAAPGAPALVTLRGFVDRPAVP